MEYIDGQSLAERIARRPGRLAHRRAAGGHGGPGRRASAPAGNHPPRPEAVEHPAGRRRPALRDRLRPGQGFRRRRRHDGHGRDRRHAELHGARAGLGPAGRRQPGDRRLQPRRDPLRVADRRAAVPRRNPAGHADGSPQRRSGHAADAQSAHPARPGTDLPEVSGEGAARSVTRRRPRWPTTWIVLPAARCWQVRPPTLLQQFWSWTRRQPALASRLGALGLFYVDRDGQLSVRHRGRRRQLSPAGVGGRGGVGRGLDRLPAACWRAGDGRFRPASSGERSTRWPCWRCCCWATARPARWWSATR